MPIWETKETLEGGLSVDRIWWAAVKVGAIVAVSGLVAIALALASVLETLLLMCVFSQQMIGFRVLGGYMDGEATLNQAWNPLLTTRGIASP